jgi:hypothetical protein
MRGDDGQDAAGTGQEEQPTPTGAWCLDFVPPRARGDEPIQVLASKPRPRDNPGGRPAQSESSLRLTASSVTVSSSGQMFHGRSWLPGWVRGWLRRMASYQAHRDPRYYFQGGYSTSVAA